MSVKQSASNIPLSARTLQSQTIQLLTDGYKPAKERLIGLEVEIPLFDVSLTPLPYNNGKNGIKQVLETLARDHGWNIAEKEDGNPVILTKKGNMITLEPGGQIEFAGAAQKSLQNAATDLKAFFKDLEKTCQTLGVNALPFGFHPHTQEKDCPFVHERSRFRALRPIFESEGSATWQQACSVQVTLDSASKEEAFDNFRFGLALQPVAAAIFANSPFAEGADSSFDSWRRQSLHALKSPYYAVPDDIHNADFGIHNWASYVLSVPMSFIVRDNAYIPVAPKPFQDMVGKPLPELSHLPEHEQYLTERDLKDHLTGIKPDMLLKPGLLLECRAADLGPDADHCLAVGAFWVGLMYDDQAYKTATDYIAGWTAQDRKIMHENVARDGLKTTVGKETMQEAALSLLSIARDGLSRIDPANVPLLDKMMEQVSQGQTPATKARQKIGQSPNLQQGLKESFLFAAKPAASTLPDAANDTVPVTKKSASSSFKRTIK